jgi:hypothetical protein
MITVLRELRSIILSSRIFLPIIAKSPNYCHCERNQPSALSAAEGEAISYSASLIKSTQSDSKGKKKRLEIPIVSELQPF